MPSTQETLFELLHITFREPSQASFEGVDWRDVLNLAKMQGVAAVAYEAVQKLPEHVLPSKTILFEWFGCAYHHERLFNQQLASAADLAEKYHEENIRTFVLKGFSLAMLYPEPKHRACGDFDCFLKYESDAQCDDAAPAFEMGNLIAEKQGVEVNRDYYIHSKFLYRGLTVENHQFLMAVKGDSKDKLYENFLREIIENDQPEYINGTWMESPSAMFQALFILSHAKGHFLNEKITLRHVCDWAVVVDSYRNDIDWTEWKNLCKKFDLLKFGYALSRVAERVCGISLPFDCKEDIGNENALLNDILKPECVIDGHSRLVRHYQIVRNILVSSWKFKMFSNTSSANYMWKRIKGFLFEKQ